MKKAIIIHGSYGSPNENWFPWLKVELEKINYHVYIPTLPTPKNQNLESWFIALGNLYKKIDSETILIGHSVGVAFILSILESLDLPVKATFLVSGFLGLLDNSEFDNLNCTFTTREFNWRKVKHNANKIYIYHSDNDPYVPTSKPVALSRKLGVKSKIISGAGHFNEQSGYIKFERLFNDIKKVS